MSFISVRSNRKTILKSFIKNNKFLRMKTKTRKLESRSGAREVIRAMKKTRLIIGTVVLILSPKVKSPQAKIKRQRLSTK